MEALVLAVMCAALGYAFGRHSSTRAVSLKQPEKKAEAYKELFDAFVDADRALMNAHMVEESSSPISEEVKEQVRTALNALIKTFESNRFLLPQEVADAMEELFAGRFGQPWSEQYDALRRVRDSIYSLARRDFEGGL